MKVGKSFLSSILLALVALFVPFSASVAAPINHDYIDKLHTTIKSATANDKVYLSYAPILEAGDNAQSLYHYSHYSHRSHSSHYSHYSSSY